GRHQPELVFLIGPEIENGRIFFVAVRTEYIRLEDGAVAHRHIDILIDDDGVSGMSNDFLFIHLRYSRLYTATEECLLRLDLHLARDLAPGVHLLREPGL